MGRIAHIQLECPSCGRVTAAYIEESDAERTNVKCEHCSTVFEFGPGMSYNPVGYVSAIPREAQGGGTPSKKWWEFWK